MFEDILGPNKSNMTDTSARHGCGRPRLTCNGKCNGIDVDGQHIYFNYVDISNGKTYNIKYRWPDAIMKKMFVKDDPVEIVFYDGKFKNVSIQKCRRLDIRSKKWDFIDIQDIIKR